jgi:GNAT superfamily N-acetyltransferase
VSVTLREAVEGDGGALLAIVDACDATYAEFAPADWAPPPAGSALWVTHLWRGSQWARVAVDDAADTVLGLVAWEPAGIGPRHPPLDGIAHLAALFVDPAHWRRGIGTRLLDAAVEAMRTARYARAELTTIEGAPAEAFYRGRGWRRDGRDGFHGFIGLPAVGYSLKL